MIINPFLGMVISAAVLIISVYLISHNIFNVPGIKKQIEKLQNKLKTAEEILSRPVKKLDPIRIAGAVILIALLIISLLNFQGFPSLGDDMFKFIGLTPDDVQDLSDYMQGLGIGGDTPEGCASTLILIQNNLDDFISGMLPESSDQGIRSILESGSGTAMTDVYEVTHEGRDIFVGISSDGDNVCSATSTRFCDCVDLKSVMP